MSPFRLINPFVVLLAKSPLHFLISSQVLVVTYTGRKSGKYFTVPVSYHKHEHTLTAVTLRTNLWWKNLKNLESAEIWFKGQLIKVNVSLEFENDVIVERNLRDLVTGNAVDAFFAKVKLEKGGLPNPADLTKAAQIHTIMQFTSELV